MPQQRGESEGIFHRGDDIGGVPDERSDLCKPPEQRRIPLEARTIDNAIERLIDAARPCEQLLAIDAILERARQGMPRRRCSRIEVSEEIGDQNVGTGTPRGLREPAAGDGEHERAHARFQFAATSSRARAKAARKSMKSAFVPSWSRRSNLR
jgi:hypothetical protein